MLARCLDPPPPLVHACESPRAPRFLARLTLCCSDCAVQNVLFGARFSFYLRRLSSMSNPSCRPGSVRRSRSSPGSETRRRVSQTECACRARRMRRFGKCSPSDHVLHALANPAARFCPAYQHFTGFDDTQSLADVVCVLGEEEYKEAIEALQ